MGKSTELQKGEKIGEFLFRIGAISEEQCAQVLEEQKKKPNVLFGEIALERGFIDDAAIDQYLESQTKQSS